MAEPECQDNTVQDEANKAIRKVGSSEHVVAIALITHLNQTVPDFNEPMAIF